MPGAPLTALARLDEAGRAEYWAALALRRSRGLGPRSISRLLHTFGSAYHALQSIERWKEAGVPIARGDALRGGDWRVLARPEWEDSRDLDGHILLWTDPRYPALLRELPDAPALLYCRGDLSLLAQPCVAIVGSRACSPHSERLAGTIARELSASGVTVVSGMARGIDHAAHAGALPGQGRTIAVLGAGLDVIYPPQHADLYHELGVHGLLISEFPPGSRPEGPHFPIRNRIISGLSMGVLVVEAAHRSGSLITARIALEQNRAVYAVPPPGWRMAETDGSEVSGGLPLSEEDGCTTLLEQGAIPVRQPADILADLFPQLQDRLTGHPSAVGNGQDAGPDGSSSALDTRDAASARYAARYAGQHTGQPRKLPLYPLRLSRSPFPTEKAGPTGSRLTDVPPPPDRPGRSPDPEPEASSPEARVLEILRHDGPLHPDALLTRLSPEDADAGRLNGWLILLEMRGVIRRRAGSVYEALA